MYCLFYREFWPSLSMGKCGYVSLTRCCSLSLSLPLFLSPSLPLFLFKIVRTIWPSLSSGKPLLIFIWVTWLSNYWLHKANIQYSNHRMGRIFAVSVDFCPTPVLYEYLSWDIPLVDDVMWPLCGYHVTSHDPRLATVWPRETTGSSTSSWSPSPWCHFMSWGATWQWSSSVSTQSCGAVLPPLGENDNPFLH